MARVGKHVRVSDVEVEDGRWLGLETIDDHDDNCDDNRLAVRDGVGGLSEFWVAARREA
jgi:hypothetical protein